MNRLIYKGFIEDVRNEKCSDLEIEKLIEVFEEAAKLMTESSAKKSYYDLGKFEGVDCAGVNSFTLNLEREKIKNLDKYTGHFECGKKNLKVIAGRYAVEHISADCDMKKRHRN